MSIKGSDDSVRLHRCVVRVLAASLTLLACLVDTRASAQVKPYFLVIVDTSYSMVWCSGGINDSSCNGQTNRCGFPANRLGDAKCALQRIIDGVGGDAVFALMEFERPCTTTCANGSFPSGSCATTTSYDDGQLLTTFVPTSPGNANVREWVDGACTGSCTNDYTRELAAGRWTPIAQSLTRANQFLRGISGTGFLYPTNQNMQPASPLAGDSQLACRPVSVILLTDGDDTCAANPTTDPPAAAAVLFAGNLNGSTAATKAFRTYVIGFGTGGDFNPAVLNNVAQSGGTDAPPTTDTRRYYAAANEAELSAALFDIVGRSIPVEQCNGLDDDCDTRIDEGLPVGQPGTAAQPESLFCDREGRRTTAQNNQVRARGGAYATIAQMASITDRVVCGRVADTCSTPGQDSDCDGKVDEDGALTACGTCPGAVDICDGIDNDCDTVIDETPNSGRPYSVCPVTCTTDVPCGSNIGECRSGFYRCVNGELNTTTCDGQVLPTTEICDEKDNDCDGVVDNPSTLARQCSPPSPMGAVGICVPGTQYCARPSVGETAGPNGYRVDQNGNPVCIGRVTPEDRELCDLLDHDCNGNAFTCTQSSCVVGPQPVGVGDACGQGVGSCVGRLYCDQTAMPPVLVCDAEGGSPEVCDGLDNDCDGAADEGLGLGGPCGSNVGECRPGNYACGPNGTQECTGGVTPVDETCDALDNDCDGKVDEGLGIGEDCGSDEGECATGKLMCLNGQTVCSGQVVPNTETCDCKDNDCDGNIDENSDDAPICPGESACKMCQCALPCEGSQEFMTQCPQGKAPVLEDGACYCVGEQCNDTRCLRETIRVGDVVQCAPNSDVVGFCTCRNNECVFPCSGVTCADGLVCDPTDGRCRQSSCLLPQFACPSNERCALVDEVFQCIADSCAFEVCGEDEACRGGDCYKSCANVQCASGERCVDGECQTEPCAGTTCEDPLACNPADGSCVVPGTCYRTGCPSGQTCDIASGECSEDICLQTRCPLGQRCNSSTGQCERRCAAGLVFCDGQCVDPRSNRDHCGASGSCTGDGAGERCGTDLVCSLGECSASCARGLLDCGGACIDPMSDEAHCGATRSCSGDEAGVECLPSETCRGGVCGERAAPVAGTGGSGNKPGRGVVAAGGGGCACSVGAGSEPTRAATRGRLALACLLLLAAAGLRRRRTRARWIRLKAARGALPLLGLLATTGLESGCEVTPFCLDCSSEDAGVRPPRDSGGGGTGGAGNGAGMDASMSTRDASDLDAQPAGDGSMSLPDACGSTELCNGIDDDCDGTVDEGADPAESGIDLQSDPLNCGACGNVCAIEHAFNACSDGECTIDRGRGENGCDIGYVDQDGDDANGCEYRCTRRADDDSACNLLDDDCDLKVDENVDRTTDRDNCGNCGLRCRFANAADGATCVDAGCVLDDTKCNAGFRNVDGKPTNGCEYRCPVQPPVNEICNALDDDCDGRVDENIVTADDGRIGIACGSMTGECRQGTTVCSMGAPVCMGGVNAVPELCDGKDNDCDLAMDEGFDRQTDVSNCGTCGNACLFNVPDGHATLECASGTCQVEACIGNWSDADGNYRNGCEKTCTITGNESCDNVDNDCDGNIDENVVAPDVVCTSRETGVCNANTTVRDALRAQGAQCTNGVLSCNPGRVNPAIPNYQATETLCDGLDNDCDGRVDETFPSVGQPCSKGIGACRTTGTNVCMGTSAVTCNAPNPSAGSTEVCDGEDNDCDGRFDELGTITGNTVGGVEVVGLGGGTLIMAHEASRPDASPTSAGTQTTKACSRIDRLPWADVTWAEANAACCALNANGQCTNTNWMTSRSSADRGWRLCNADTWRQACQGAGNACTWAYSTLGACAHASNDTMYADLCLGAETLMSCAGGATQCATTTGDFMDCYREYGSVDVYDLSGNLKEWTYTETSAGSDNFQIRGGSYSNLEPGRSCTFDFTVGNTSYRFPTTGFRCCYYP